jgi:hypothetical protein
MSHIKILLAASIGLLCISNAHSSEYVCLVGLVPPPTLPVQSNLGNLGYVTYYTSPAPNCGGANTQWFACSTGATSSVCAVDAQYSEAGLLGLYDSLRRAQESQKQIYVTTNKCIPNQGQCASVAMFYPFP